MSMFLRHNQTYNFDDKLINKIIHDSANPLNIISDIIPPSSAVLDIGAGNGLLALLFREKKKSIIIDGVEKNEHAARLASPYYRYFFTGGGQDYFTQVRDIQYNFIILADVIEHLFDPLALLKQLTIFLPANSKIILSVPNVAFGSVRLSLLNGRFDYADSGLLERTHLRFFTLKSLQDLFSRASLNIHKTYFLQRNFLKSEIKFKLHLSDMLTFLRICHDELSSVYQFIFILSKEKNDLEIIKQGTKIRHPFLTFFKHWLKSKKYEKKSETKSQHLHSSL